MGDMVNRPFVTALAVCAGVTILVLNVVPYLDDGASELNDNSLVFDGADALSEVHPREPDVLL